ncbi:hypothetical protein H2200_001160 [Cladophialophora chaetospira]|uniref:BTB domain-containing protein n=1 Tax=Cladophialophora chaetospira TaxID=386627 RepID=A0AA39CNS8_9EURO|nr:hypothetical protein H2200_001160 [Cladophialophora chaetospira]
MASSSPSGVIDIDPSGDLVLSVGEVFEPKSAPETQAVTTKKRAPKPKLMRVSSKHLTLASPVFNVMLNGGFHEGQLQLNKDNPPVLELPDDDAQGMLTLCCILHHHPDALSFVMLDGVLEVARICDKYGCQPVGKSWFHHQLLQRGRSWLTLTPSRLGLLVQAALTFDDFDIFYLSTTAALRKFSGRMLLQVVAALDDTVPEGFFTHLRTVQIELLNMLSSKCQEVTGELIKVRSSKTDHRNASVSWDGNEVKLPDVCVGQAKRSGKLIAALCAVELWGKVKRGYDNVSIENAIDAVANIAATVDEGNSCANRERCESCQMSWKNTIVEMLEEFREQIYGICLECIKNMDNEHLYGMIGSRCCRHRAPAKVLMTHALEG